MKGTIILFLRKIGLPILKKIGRNIKITHHFTGDRFVLHSYLHKGYWFYAKNREASTIKLFEKYIKEKDSVIEVGGHIGYMSLIFRNLVGKNGRVVVFEPGPNNLPYIRENIATYSNIELIEKGVGAENHVLKFFIDNLTGQNNSFVEDFEGFEINKKAAFDSSATTQAVDVEIVRLDTFVSSMHLDAVNFIKIDVEGFEYEVLLGAKELLKRDMPVIMVEVQRNQALVADLLLELGYVLINEEGTQISKTELVNFKSNNIFALSPILAHKQSAQ